MEKPLGLRDPQGQHGHTAARVGYLDRFGFAASLSMSIRSEGEDAADKKEN
jgi:hypothetical protein